MEFAIETTGLCKRLGGLEVIRGCDLRVPAGGVYGFIGPNGAGKTTAMRLILGILQPDAGTVRLLGEDMASDPRAALARTGAFVESPALYDHLSGEANLDITRRLLRLERSEIGRVLDIVDMTRHASRKVAEYSLGMRQRTALARALLGAPQLLMLDEPTNGLDPEGISEMRELIRGLPDRIGATVFVSSHLLAEVEQIADTAGLLRAGQVALEGPLKDLLAGERAIHLRTDRRDDALALLEARGFLPRASGRDGLDVVCSANTGADSFAAEIARLLIDSGIAVYALGEKKRTLEDLYKSSAGAGLKGMAA